MTRADQTNQEMERGRQIAGRAKRGSDLERLQRGKKVQVMVALPGHQFYESHGRVNLFYVADVMIAHQNADEDDYPSENVMAFIGLAVEANGGTGDVPPPDPTHHVSPQAKEYNRLMAARIPK